MKRSFITAFIFLIQVTLFAQLPNGSLAPDFTLTDYNGNVHSLHDYLNDGKTVILEIFAAHCPICWNFHQTNRLKNLYQTYGPEGTDELMVLALEYDQWNNHNAFIGIGEPWVTQGNWLDGTPYPIFNVEDPHRGVFNDYNIVGYPQVYKICPDGIVEIISTSESESQIYNKVQQCQIALSTNDLSSSNEMYFNSLSKTLSFDAGGKPWSLRIWNLHGQLINSVSSINSSSIQLDQLITGVYLFEIKTEGSSFAKRMFWH
jgi:cytochrome oxidase Cu insertion factor (SCO1/SenC/PrrC family)